MRAKLLLFAWLLGTLVVSAPAIAQDTLFISLGDDLLHTAIPAGTGDISNTPGQVDGGLTGATWNLVNTADQAPVLEWSDGTASSAFVKTGRGSGGGAEGSTELLQPNTVLWWGTIGSNGTYAGSPDVDTAFEHMVDLTGILTGPAVSQGMSFQKSAGLRIRGLPVGDYEVYVTAVPYSRNSNTGGALEGQDVDVYVGTSIDNLGGAEQILEESVTDGSLTRTTLPHENYATWEEGDNYVRAIVTIGLDEDEDAAEGATESLLVAADMSLQSTGLDSPLDIGQIFGTLGTIEIRRISTAGLEGDYNNNGFVDAADYTVWRDNLGRSIALPNEVETIGSVTSEDYTTWKSNFGNSGSASGSSISTSSVIPEPTNACLAMLALLGILGIRKRRQSLR